MSTYSYDGELLESNQVRNVRQLFYNTREMVELDVDCDEYSYYNPATRSAVATCLLYEAAEGWYGLMSPDGRLVTPPSYSRVEAIGKDLYLCVSIYGRGVVVDSKGQLVK